MFRITVLMSGKHGRGSNMAALHDACVNGKIPDARIVAVVGTHPDSPALERAQSLGLDIHLVRSLGEQFDAELLATLQETSPNLICLAGYMRKIPEAVIEEFKHKIVNIHPALLPSFGGKGMYGGKIHEAVLEYGCKVSGCTVHYIDAEFDTGPIIYQECVPVLEGDTPETLGARVLVAEHASYSRAVGLIAQGRVSVEGRRVRVAQE